MTSTGPGEWPVTALPAGRAGEGPAGERGEHRPPAGDAARRAAAAVAGILADLTGGGHRGLVVDSPPGAGKSTLVVRAAADLAAAGQRLMVAAQTVEQADDLVERLVLRAPGLRVGRLVAQGYRPPVRLARHASVVVAGKVDDLGEPPVTIATAAKWATLVEGRWPWAIVDEAYQMRSDLLLRIANRFDRALFVGDPGQLDPFSTVEVDRWTGLTWDPMQSAVAVLLRHNPDLPVHRLPVSWRLPASAAAPVARAFYPYTGFEAGTAAGQRRLVLGRAGGGEAGAVGVAGAVGAAGAAVPGAAGPTPADAGRPDAGWLDAVLDRAAATGWALAELPERHTVRTDPEAVQTIAALARRLLARAPVGHCEQHPDGAPVGAQRIAIGAAHRDQVAAIRAALGSGAAAQITVDTANRLQGREYDVTLVLHPLSGRRDATAFHLESGRLCVLASRHRHACVVVARAGIAELLDAHPDTGPVHLNVPVRFPDGWEANQAMLAHLAGHRVPAPARCG